MQERRKSGRVKLKRVLSRIAADFETPGVRASGFIAKLSREGMFVSSEVLPRPGDAVRLVFRDLQGNEIEVRGSVRWTTAQLDASRTGFGMQIDRVSDEYAEFYQSILTS